jgi:hypothetical protein
MCLIQSKEGYAVFTPVIHVIVECKYIFRSSKSSSDIDYLFFTINKLWKKFLFRSYVFMTANNKVFFGWISEGRIDKVMTFHKNELISEVWYQSLIFRHCVRILLLSYPLWFAKSAISFIETMGLFPHPTDSSLISK